MEKEKKDIFDRMMGWGFLKTFEPFYKAHKEVLLYLFFGGLTTVVSVIFFAIPMNMLDLGEGKLLGFTIDYDVTISNVISWVCAVTFAYVTNRTWVFEDKAHGAKPVAVECAAFFAGRLFTLVVETLLLNVMTTTLKMQEIIAKIIVSIVTIILNYIISKLFVFKKEKE
ncbi:MAG: GtrA family protein [Ruminococcus sp.]|nr:GtrA family protein [Ruminococcus sp.]